MNNQLHPTQHNPNQLTTNVFSKFGTKQKLSIALVTLLYVILLTIFYHLGYHFGSTFSIKDITTSMISKTTSPYQPVNLRSSEPFNKKSVTLCGKPVPAEDVRQTIIDRVYNGTSPYEDFILTRVNSSSLVSNRISDQQGRYRVIYKRLIHKVRPTTIIQFSNSLDVSAIYIANLTNQLGLKTQILCLDEFLNSQNVISHNATKSILPVNLPINSASEHLCQWGIYGDIVEVDTGRDFHSAWSDIGKAYKLLRPSGVIFGHNYFSSDSSYYDKGDRQAARLFARVNKIRFEEDEHHWMVNSA